jgi:sucrose-6-phosphate hydrolase SacC (GH32 family)
MWGNMTWDLVISKDFIHWFYLEDVMELDRWYNDKGVCSCLITTNIDNISFRLYTRQIIRPNFGCLFIEFILKWISI